MKYRRVSYRYIEDWPDGQAHSIWYENDQHSDQSEKWKSKRLNGQTGHEVNDSTVHGSKGDLHGQFGQHESNVIWIQAVPPVEIFLLEELHFFRI